MICRFLEYFFKNLQTMLHQIFLINSIIICDGNYLVGVMNKCINNEKNSKEQFCVPLTLTFEFEKSL